MEVDETLTPTRSYVYGGNKQLMAENSQGRYFNHYGDTVGNLKQVSDVSGAIVTEKKYDAFGNERIVAGTDHLGYGYTGEQIDAQTGLIYLRARYYDPMLGRFISVDPYLGRLEVPESQNRFIYVHNNAVSFTDPSGLMPMTGCEMSSGGCYEPDVNGPHQPPDYVLQATFEYSIVALAFVPTPVQPIFAWTSFGIGVKNSVNQYSKENYFEGNNLAATSLMSVSTKPWLKGASFMFETANYFRGINEVPPLDDTFSELWFNYDLTQSGGHIVRIPERNFGFINRSIDVCP